MIARVITDSLKEARFALDQLLSNAATINNIQEAAQLLIKTFEGNQKVITCGNGGSMCDAIHFAEEMTGQYRKKRQAFPVIAISDPAHLTCVGNDYGFEEVFSRYILAHGKPGDCLLAISTSGTSPNILAAVAAAQSLNMPVIGLGGRVNSALMQQADIPVCTPGGEFADRVQEIHIKVLHILIEIIERHFCPQNYG